MWKISSDKNMYVALHQALSHILPNLTKYKKHIHELITFSSGPTIVQHCAGDLISALKQHVVVKDSSSKCLIGNICDLSHLIRLMC